ncbi:MAG: hypothetical protein ACYDH3_07180 [Candidatus Aminicenantales bacterium]
MNAAKIILGFMAAIFCALAAFAGPADLKGIWVGKAELPEQALDRIVLVLEETGLGIAGTISDGLELIRPETALVGLRTDGKALAFHFQAVDGLTLVFTLNALGDQMTGWWTDPDGASGKIALVRKM